MEDWILMRRDIFWGSRGFHMYEGKGQKPALAYCPQRCYSDKGDFSRRSSTPVGVSRGYRQVRRWEQWQSLSGSYRIRLGCVTRFAYQTSKMARNWLKIDLLFLHSAHSSIMVRSLVNKACSLWVWSIKSWTRSSTLNYLSFSSRQKSVWCVIRIRVKWISPWCLNIKISTCTSAVHNVLSGNICPHRS